MPAQKSFFYIFCLSTIFFGIQIIWTLEFGAGNPYLISLGMKPELTAFVWLCGPVAGLIVQPLIGYYSDRSSSTYFGKRKPFLFAGLLLVTLALLMIGVIAPGSNDRNAALHIAVAGFYILDFSINVLMSSARSFLVDSLEGHQQVLGNSFVGRMLNAGDLCGYFIGGLDLSAILSVKGEFEQMRLLCLLGIVILWASGLVTLLFTTEEPHHSYVNLSSAATDSYGVFAPFRAIVKAIWTLTPPIQKLCETQFFNWLGWFPFLFYSSTWLIASSQSHGHQESSRMGSRGLFLFSLLSLFTSLTLPYIQHRFNIPLSKLWSLSLFFSFFVIQMTIFHQNSPAMILLTVSLMGIPWFATGWAPFALISLELTKRAQEDAMTDDDTQIPDSPHSYTSLESALANSPGNGCESGLVLGIHNMYICIPQLLSSLVTSFVFFILDGNGPEALGWVIRVGSVFTCVAAFKAWHLA